MALGHDVSRELRGQHGRWTKTGAALHRMTEEASASRAAPDHETVLRSVSTVAKGTGKTIGGHRIDRTQKDKYRVGLKTSSGRDTKLYGTAQDAAKAISEGKHHDSGTEAAVRSITGGGKKQSYLFEMRDPDGSVYDVHSFSAGSLKEARAMAQSHPDAKGRTIHFEGGGKAPEAKRPQGAVEHKENALTKSEEAIRQESLRKLQQNPRTVKVQSGTAHVRDIAIPQSGKAEPWGSKLPMRDLPAGYTAHQADPQKGYGDKGKPNIEIWHKDEGHVATLKYKDYLSQKRGRVGNISAGSYRTTGYRYELTHPEVKAANRESYQQAIKENRYPGQYKPGSDIERPQGKSAQAAIQDHETRLARARGTTTKNYAPMTPELREQIQRIQAEQKAKTEAENKNRGGVTENRGAGVGVGKPNLAGGATPPKSTPADRVMSGVSPSGMSDAELQKAYDDLKARESQYGTKLASGGSLAPKALSEALWAVISERSKRKLGK